VISSLVRNSTFTKAQGWSRIHFAYSPLGSREDSIREAFSSRGLGISGVEPGESRNSIGAGGGLVLRPVNDHGTNTIESRTAAAFPTVSYFL